MLKDDVVLGGPKDVEDVPTPLIFPPFFDLIESHYANLISGDP
jgi:hypothetical protein